MTPKRKQKKTNSNGDSVLKLSRNQIIGLIDHDAKKRLGIGAGELLHEYRTGQLQNPGAVADLLVIADLLKRNDPIFGRT